MAGLESTEGSEGVLGGSKYDGDDGFEHGRES